jgi:hypothetical protein
MMRKGPVHARGHRQRGFSRRRPVPQRRQECGDEEDACKQAGHGEFSGRLAVRLIGRGWDYCSTGRLAAPLAAARSEAGFLSKPGFYTEEISIEEGFHTIAN